MKWQYESYSHRCRPELIFINDLLSAEDPDASLQTVIHAKISSNFDDELLQVVDAVEGLLMQQGQQEAVEHLGVIREALASALS